MRPLDRPAKPKVRFTICEVGVVIDGQVGQDPKVCAYEQLGGVRQLSHAVITLDKLRRRQPDVAIAVVGARLEEDKQQHRVR